MFYKKIFNKIYIVLLIMLFVFTLQYYVYAKDFTDVPTSNEYNEAVTHLSNKGIINGYSDGSFGINNKLTRAEAATILVRAMGKENSTASKSAYSDVAENYWGKKYIMIASQNGIINGLGNGLFAPENNVSYAEILKMTVCMINKESDAAKNGGWPHGYIKTAYDNNLIDLSTYLKIGENNVDSFVNRGEVSKIIYNAVKIHREKNQSMKNKEISQKKTDEAELSYIIKPVYNNAKYKAYVKCSFKGNTIWEHTTGEYPVTELNGVSELLIDDSKVYYVANAYLIAMDKYTGRVCWSVGNAGASSHLAQDDKNIYVCGYYGPNVLIVSKNGDEWYRDHFDNYYYAHEIKLNGNALSVRCDMPEDGVITMNIQKYKGTDLNNFKSKMADIDKYTSNILENAATMMDMNSAAQVSYSEWDSFMNQIYNYLERNLDATSFDKVKKEQQTWYSKRDAKMNEAKLEWEGGSGQTMAVYSAGAEYTKERCKTMISLIK